MDKFQEGVMPGCKEFCYFSWLAVRSFHLNGIGRFFSVATVGVECCFSAFTVEGGVLSGNGTIFWIFVYSGMAVVSC